MPDPAPTVKTITSAVAKPSLEQRLAELEQAVESLGAPQVDAERQHLNEFVLWYLKRVAK